MAGFTTTNDGWSFSFEDPKPVLDTSTPNIGQPYLAGADRWKNYSDQELYEIECLLRQFLETKRNGWGSPRSSDRKFTAKMMYEILYGEPAPADAYATIRKLNRVMNHYATRVYKKRNTTIHGVRVRSNVYMLSALRLDKPPFSLRLRLEWMAEQGIMPTYENMQLSEKLQPGQTRTANNAKYRARKVKYERTAKRARNDELYGNASS